MDERLRQWRPTREEVDQIITELRPLIRDLARRDQEQVARQVFFRRLSKVG